MDTTLEDKRSLIFNDTPKNVAIPSGLLASFLKMEATSDEKALGLVKNDNPPDLILFDVQLLRINGFEIYRHLKAESELAHDGREHNLKNLLSCELRNGISTGDVTVNMIGSNRNFGLAGTNKAR